MSDLITLSMRDRVRRVADHRTARNGARESLQWRKPLSGVVARGRRSPLHPLDGAGKRQQRTLARFQKAAQKDHRAAGAGDFARALDQLALACGVEKLATERHRHRRTL